MKTVRLNVPLDPGLHSKVKIFATKNNRTIKSIVLELLEKAVKDGNEL
jgi:hypothetical protein